MGCKNYKLSFFIIHLQTILVHPHFNFACCTLYLSGQVLPFYGLLVLLGTICTPRRYLGALSIIYTAMDTFHYSSCFIYSEFSLCIRIFRQLCFCCIDCPFANMVRWLPYIWIIVMLKLMYVIKTSLLAY